jgi:MSHA biogenesis protein MshM
VVAALVAGLFIGFFVGRMSANGASSSAVGTSAAGTANASTRDRPASGAAVAGLNAPTPPPAPTGAPTAATANQTPAVAQPPALSSAAGETTETEGDWLARRIAADAARIAAVPVNRFAIQLLTSDERERSALENFLRVANRELNADRVMLYSSGTKDNPKVSVLYGNYAERNEAAAELSGLPSKLTQFRPYVRSFQAIRDDARR